MLPMAVRSFAGALTAFGRLNIFLLTEEVEDMVTSAIGSDGVMIDITNADFIWDGTEPTLQGINLKLKKGQTTAIVGDVGSGKSSLLAAILRQIKLVKGDIKVCGSVS